MPVGKVEEDVPSPGFFNRVLDWKGGFKDLPPMAGNNYVFLERCAAATIEAQKQNPFREAGKGDRPGGDEVTYRKRLGSASRDFKAW